MRSRALNVVVAMLMVCGFTRPQDACGEPDWRSLIVADGPTAESERQALVAAIRVLPRLPARVAVIDANEAAPEVKATLLQLDTFITRGSPVVYVLRHSPLLQGARAGSTFHTLALAAAVWHEIAHINGADEHEARKREESLWTSFVRDQRVDQVTALRYLTALSKRPDDQLMASR
jgi:hypothetical protein